MNRRLRFRFQDLVVITCIALIMLVLVVPARIGSLGRSRAAVCRNNLKLIGVGLELWRDNSGRYPPWDLPEGVNLHPWPDVLALNPPFDEPPWLEDRRPQLESLGLKPEDFIRTVDDDKIFMCPADHPHPHRINADRARAWGFWRSDEEDGYEYSYTTNVLFANKKYHP